MAEMHGTSGRLLVQWMLAPVVALSRTPTPSEVWCPDREKMVAARDSNLRTRAYVFLAFTFVGGLCRSLLSGFWRNLARNRGEWLWAAGRGFPLTE